MDLVFLGVNDVGMRVYDWLCDRDGVSVRALLTTDDQLDLVKEIEPDTIVSVGFGHLVPKEVLAVPNRGAFNLHPSLLPYNRGVAPNVWSIVDDTPAGATLHYMDEEFDTGDIVAQRRIPVEFDDTGRSLHRRLEEVQFELFTETWPDIQAGTVESKSQPDGGTYYSQDDFDRLCSIDTEATYTAKELLDVLRALTFPPFDNAHVEVDGDRYYVDVDVRHEDDQRDEDPEGLLSSY